MRAARLGSLSKPVSRGYDSHVLGLSNSKINNTTYALDKDKVVNKSERSGVIGEGIHVEMQDPGNQDSENLLNDENGGHHVKPGATPSDGAALHGSELGDINPGLKIPPVHKEFKRKIPRGKSGVARTGEGCGGRVSKGKWVVTMMVPGRKLWGSSPAMVSQYKRFRRSRQAPKIARDQVRSA